MKRQLLAVALAALPLLVAAAPRYSLQVLATDSNGYGSDSLNNAGQFLIGRKVNGGMYAYLGGPGGTTASLGTLGGSTVYGSDLNDTGLVVGSSAVAGNAAMHAFVYANGSMLDIGTLGGANSYATGVNASGVVVGTSDIDGGVTRGFIYTETGGMRDIGTLGGAGSRISGISDSGEILGRAQTASGEWHSFLYKDGQMTDIHVAGEELYGIGANGEIYGSTYDEIDHEFGLVLKRSDWYPANEWTYGLGAPTDIANGYMVGWDYRGAFSLLATKDEILSLNHLAGEGWDIGNASAVNDLGQVLAYGCNWDQGNGCAAVLLSPVPEPVTYGMLGVGLGIIALARRRQAAAVSRSA